MERSPAPALANNSQILGLFHPIVNSPCGGLCIFELALITHTNVCVITYGSKYRLLCDWWWGSAKFKIGLIVDMY